MTNAISYSNLHVLPDGNTTEHLLTEDAGSLHYTVRTTGGETTTILGEAGMTLAQAVAAEPALALVGTGFTQITYDGPIALHDLLGLLVVDDPLADEQNAEGWADADGNPTTDLFDVDEMLRADEEMSYMVAGGDHEIVTRWIMINDDRGFVLRGDGFAAVGLVDPDSDWNKPYLTEELLSWSFYGESGGPCTWDGGADYGRCGPNLWALRRWGDSDPIMLIFPAPAPEDEARAITADILELDWELPFLLSAVGVPGLSDEDRSALWGAKDVEGQEVSSYLPQELEQQVVDLLCNAYPPLREAVDSLRDPDSERGQIVYAWLRQIAHGSYQSGSWNHVYQAMLGYIEAPEDDQRAPTMAERMEDNMRRVQAVIANAQGVPLEEFERRTEEKRANEQLSASLSQQVTAALATPHEDDVRRLQAQLDDLRQAMTKGAESRAFLGFEEDGESLHTRAKARMAENPDDEAWVADVWSNFWTASGAPSAEDEADLRRELEAAEGAWANAREDEALKAKEAEDAGWPAGWRASLYEVWLAHGGTMASARAWADAQYGPVDVLLGTPPGPEAMANLRERLTDENPNNAK
ncbi:MAG: hypothetical protein Q4G35_04800 [Propionibacteriaceae bacterium]|nr:hypothetical protein [Propionibacteriaceae bacterium]